MSWAEGEILVSNANCTACHQASRIAIRRLAPAPAPILLGERGVGSRLSPSAIRQRLGAHGAQLGQRMPDLIHGGIWDEGNSSVTGAGGAIANFRSAYHKGYGVDDADRYGPAMPDIIDLMQRIDDHNEAVKA